FWDEMRRCRRPTRIEFPRFRGDGVKDLLFKSEHYFQDLILKRFGNVETSKFSCNSVMNSSLSLHLDDEEDYVVYGCYQERNEKDTSVLKVFEEIPIKKIFRQATSAEYSDVKESVEVGSGLVEEVVVETVKEPFEGENRLVVDIDVVNDSKENDNDKKCLLISNKIVKGGNGSKEVTGKPMVKMRMNGSIMSGNYRVSGITRESEVTDESKISDNTPGGRVSLYQPSVSSLGVIVGKGIETKNGSSRASLMAVKTMLENVVGSVKSIRLEDLLVVGLEVMKNVEYRQSLTEVMKNILLKTSLCAIGTSGAWIMGYKGMGALLGLLLAKRDIIVAFLDYRACECRRRHLTAEQETLLLATLIHEVSFFSDEIRGGIRGRLLSRI
ncbi:hypothetical protein Tco_1323139, partial [Tanacetum coccineum]